MKRLVPIAMLAVLMALTACSEKIEVLKSPCVGLEGSPCGPKRPVNGPLHTHAQPVAEQV